MDTLKHWYRSRGPFHMLWIGSDGHSYTNDHFTPLVTLSAGRIIHCWRVKSKSSPHDEGLEERGPWHGIEGEVSAQDITVTARFPLVPLRSGRRVTAVFGLGILEGHSAAGTAAELFEQHKDQNEWTTGLAIGVEKADGNEMSTLPFSYWIDSRTSTAKRNKETPLALEKLLSQLGPKAIVAGHARDVNMRSGTVWVSLEPIEDLNLSVSGERIQSDSHEARRWGTNIFGNS